MAQVFNYQFLLTPGLPKIGVKKTSLKWVISQRFNNPSFQPAPGPWSTDLFNIPHVDVEIVIDFITFREDRKIKIGIRQIGFVRRNTDPNELMTGYPFSEIMCWKTPWGENFASWSSRLASNGAVRPTERELFNGRTRSEIRNEIQKGEIREQIRYK